MIRGFSKRHLKRLASKEIRTMFEPEIYIKQDFSNQSSNEDNVDKFPENEFFCVPDNDTKILLNSLKAKIDGFECKLDIVMRQQAQTLSLLKHLINKKVRVKSPSSIAEFPIKSPDGLERMNELIRTSKSMEPFVESIQHQLGEKGLTKNLERIFDMSLILDMNFDGIRDKIALKPYTHIIECIFEAVRKDGDHLDDFIKSLRNAIRLNKNKYFKKKSIEKKKNRMLEDE